MSISAPQLGFDDVGLFVMCERKNWGNLELQYSDFTPILNPAVTDYSEDTAIAWEGCPSDPHHLYLIERPLQIKAQF